MRYLVLCAGVLVAGCSSSGGSGAASGGLPENNVLGLETNTVISLDLAGASRDNTSGVLSEVDYENQFWIRAAKNGTRVIRYGKVGEGNSGKSDLRRHVYRIPISETVLDGVTVNSGTLSVVRTEPGDDVLPNALDSRDFAVTEITQNSSLAGILDVVTCCQTGAAGVTDVYGYSGGIDATDLPSGGVTYSGSFLATVIGAGGAVNQHGGDASLSVDFATGDVDGTLGNIDLSGAQVGTDISGTATLGATAYGIAGGSIGTFDGGLFGPGGREAAGTLAIESNADGARLVGAFGAAAD